MPALPDPEIARAPGGALRPRVAARSHLVRAAAALCVYLLLAVAYTHPVLSKSFTGIANDPYDPILNTSILWWNATVVPFSSSWWSPPHFHPTPDVAAFTENLVGISVIATPIFWVTDSALAAYNISFVLSWPLSAFSTYLLVWFLVRRHDAAFLAGLAWAFTPYRIAEVAHLQMLSVYWFPLVLLGLHGYLEQRRRWWLVLFAVAWVLQSLANGYFLFFGSVLIGLWLVYFCARRVAWRAIPGIAIAWAAANLALAPVLWKYYAIHQHFGLTRSMSEVIAFSAPPKAWIQVSSFVRFWHHFLRDSETPLFPGLTMLLIVASGALVCVRRRRLQPAAVEPGPRAWVVVSSLALLLSLTAIAVTMTIGPWSRTILGVTIRVTDLNRAVAVSMAAALALLFLLRRPGATAGSPPRFYLAAAAVMGVLCLGPALRSGEFLLFEEMPYRWLMRLPGFDGIRVPHRFWMLGTLCLAIAAGFSFARYGPERGPLRRFVFALAIAGILIDGWAVIGMPDAPPQWPKAERRDRTEAVIELPLGPSWDAAATFRAMRHRRPVVNGVSGYDPPFYAPLQFGLNGFEPSILTALSSFGSLDVVVNGDADPDGAWARYAASVAGEPIATDGVRRIYRVARTPVPVVALGAALPIAAVSASSDTAALAHDGRLDTEWHENPRQLPGHWLTGDLGSVRSVGGLTMALGEWARDFPRHLAIDVSRDGATWSAAWEGATVTMAMLAAIERPRECAVRIAFPAQDARFVRLRSLADHKNLWRVAELQVHAPASGTDATRPR